MKDFCKPPVKCGTTGAARPPARFTLMVGLLLLGGCEHGRRDTPRTATESPSSSASTAALRGSAKAAAPDAAAPMVVIAGGVFSMRDTERRRGVDIVVHAPKKTSVAPFTLDATEVTAGSYMGCVTAQACPPPRPQDRDDPLCTGLRPGYEHHPMTCVDWSQATAYCAAQSKRLPTEVEWEYAARGGQADASFPWGNPPPVRQLCWFSTQKGLESCPVGSFPLESLGTYDLAGNIEEWTATAEEPIADESLPPSSIPKNEFRVIRGGQFGTNAEHGILRHSIEWMKHHSGAVGFRCARSR